MKYINFFKDIKLEIEEYWSTKELDEQIYGFQIQKGTKFISGLHSEQIHEYEDILGLKFPEILVDFLTVMNGTDLPTINIYGNENNDFKYSIQFYSYPRDINLVKEMIDSVYNSFNVNQNDLLRIKASRIFPIFSHRFLMIDSPNLEVLSIYYDDAIYWERNLINLLENEILGKSKIGFDDSLVKKNISSSIRFWVDN